MPNFNFNFDFEPKKITSDGSVKPFSKPLKGLEKNSSSNIDLRGTYNFVENSTISTFNNIKPLTILLDDKSKILINNYSKNNDGPYVFFANKYGTVVANYNNANVMKFVYENYYEGINCLRVGEVRKSDGLFNPFNGKTGEYMLGTSLTFLAAASLSYVSLLLAEVCPDVDLGINSGTTMDNKVEGSAHLNGLGYDIYTVFSTYRKNIKVNADDSISVVGVENKEITTKYNEYQYFYPVLTINGELVNNENLSSIFDMTEKDKVESHLYLKVDTDKVDINNLRPEIKEHLIYDGLKNVLSIRDKSITDEKDPLMESTPLLENTQTVDLPGVYLDFNDLLGQNWTSIAPIVPWRTEGRTFLDLETHHLQFELGAKGENYYLPVDETGRVLTPEEFAPFYYQSIENGDIE